MIRAMKAIRVHEPGGPEVLKLETVPEPNPGPGEARVRLEASGVNFIDVYHRTGLYKNPLPFTPGMEGAGMVEAVGAGVLELKPGDRVSFAMTLGAYAEKVLVPAWKLVPVPAGVDTATAAALMLQGMTAHYLTHSTFRLEPGHKALVHAAAGGVGLLLVQIAKRSGAHVIGTVSTEAKAQLALKAGADQVVVYMSQDFEAEVKKLTGGRGVDVVYDSVGIATYEKSLLSLAPRGMLVLYGQSSGAVPPIDPLQLSARGSLFLTRPSLAHYTQDRTELLARAGDLFGWIARRELDVRIEKRLSLAEAADAHRLLESRQTAGKLLLIP